MITTEEVQGNLFGPNPRLGAKWGQQRRFEFIDYRLRWDGYFNRSDLTNFFGISVPQASLDISEYLKLASDNLEYDHKTKVYRATASFRPVFSSSSLERYLDDLLGTAVSTDTPYGSFLGWHPPVSSVPRPGRRLNTNIVIAVTNAIRNQSSIKILYQSFSDINPAVRNLSPHALVHDGFRWHMRAYCHLRNEFRDFLLSRILEIHETESDQDRSEYDTAWHKIINLILAPHPLLGEAQRKVTELDYGMTNGSCELSCRQALLFYVLRQLGLEKNQSDISPKSQQIILLNWEDIEPYLPNNEFR